MLCPGPSSGSHSLLIYRYCRALECFQLRNLKKRDQQQQQQQQNTSPVDRYDSQILTSEVKQWTYWTYCTFVKWTETSKGKLTISVYVGHNTLLYIFCLPLPSGKNGYISFKSYFTSQLVVRRTSLCLILYENTSKTQTEQQQLEYATKKCVFSKIINRMQPVAQCVTCSHVWLLYPRGHLTFSGSGCCTCNMPSLPYHHYPDTNHNKQPLILLELQKNTGSTDPYHHLQNRTRTLA